MESPPPAPSLVKIIFPEPEDNDFDEDIADDERKYYISKYKDLDTVKTGRLHCTACDRHLGSAPKSDSRMKVHPMMKTLVCKPCHNFYNSGEFERGDDGSELYCRWCGQGGQVYCCASCPHVFCAKCIKRNFGSAKINEIESLDDWKCFRCVPRDLWDLRAQCWALLRYCDYKNRRAMTCEDQDLKEKYTKECAVDDAECCKSKKRTSIVQAKKKDQEEEKNKVLAKIPQGIKVKKFASMPDTKNQLEKKAMKRPGSPLKPLVTGVRAPIPIAPYPRQIPPNIPAPMTSYIPAKKMKLTPQPPPMNPSFPYPRPLRQYARPTVTTPTIIRKPPAPHMNSVYNFSSQGRNHNFTPQTFNGLQNYLNSDNINLSLDSLTQGLDMNSLPVNPSSSTISREDELVCTPDFPLEPLCEVIEDPVDDDVECITPGPVAKPKMSTPKFNDIDPENVVQMTENDVTVNAVTGGLKFRVDPQTLSSNKMYRLPDGRIFAINANANMPGGYSATIVAVNEGGKTNNLQPGRGSTFAANISTIITPNKSTPIKKGSKKEVDRTLRSANKKSESKSNELRKLDMKTPVEWYRYNLLDSIDSLQYSMSKLQRMKKEVDTHHLRSRTVEEMKTLHRQLDRHLQTSITRFGEIQVNLNRGFRTYLKDKKKVTPNIDCDDDDDIEILNDKDPDPIFIDENSLDSASHSDHEVTALSSEHNDSNEHNKSDNIDPLADLTHIPSDNEDTEKNNSADKSEEDVEINENTESSNTTRNLANSTAEVCKIKVNDVEKITNNRHKEKTEEKITEKVTEEHDNNDHLHEEKAEEEKILEKDSTVERKITDNVEKGKAEKDNTAEKSDNVKKGKNSEENTDNVEKGKAAQEETDNVKRGKSAEDNNAEKENPSEENDNDSIENLQKEEGTTNQQINITSLTSLNDESSDVNNINKKSVKPTDSPLESNNKSDAAAEDKSKESNKEMHDKQNGMEVDAPEDLKGDSEIQMSDEMIDNLLADDGQSGELTEELQKLTETSLDSLADADLMNSEFN